MLSVLMIGFIIAILSVSPRRVCADDFKWHEGTEFEIQGKGWTVTDGPYDRLPARMQSVVPQLVWDLSKNSAGVCLKFNTDADIVKATWSLTSESLAMPHMPATGVSGLDLYIRTPRTPWRFLNNGRPGKQNGNETDFDMSSLGHTTKECMLYLPLYNGVSSIRVGFPSKARVEMTGMRPSKEQKPIVVYGTSIAQGGCASRPGMVWSSILGRKLDVPAINLGFSASGTMEPPIGEVLAEIDASVYIIDCIWNIGNQDQALFDRIVGNLVSSIRKKHAQTPIVFVGQSYYYMAKNPFYATKNQENAVKALIRKGDRNLHNVSDKHLIGDDAEATVDSVHLTDLGMLRQADVLYPIIKKLL